MKIQHFVPLIVLAASASLAGCASDPPQGNLGQLQNLRFELATPEPCTDCGPERAMVPAGALVDVDVYNLGRKIHYQVRSSAPAVAEFHSIPRCMFLDDTNCHETVSMRTHLPGQADLEVFDEWTGTILDRYTVNVVDLTDLELKSKR